MSDEPWLTIASFQEARIHLTRHEKCSFMRRGKKKSSCKSAHKEIAFGAPVPHIRRREACSEARFSVHDTVANLLWLQLQQMVNAFDRYGFHWKGKVLILHLAIKFSGMLKQTSKSKSKCCSI